MNDETKAVDIIYLDFQMAFDKRQLTKLRLCGISGNFHKWLEDLLSARKQRSVINGKTLSVEKF